MGLSHPLYRIESTDYQKWRLTYESGAQFKIQYLQKYSTYESEADFAARSNMSYCPAFAKAAVNEVIGSICARLKDVVRDGPDRYKTFLENVDNSYMSMETFVSTKVLQELLVMRKVGICIDRGAIPDGASIADVATSTPYLYIYTAEDILSWKYNKFGVLTDVLLKHETYGLDTFGLPSTEEVEYKRYFIAPDRHVVVEYYKDESFKNKIRTVNTVLTLIPVVIVEISSSLMTDISDYQIALLNMESSDVSYIIRSNIPFYTEQYDVAAQNQQKSWGEAEDKTEPDEKIIVGSIRGRKYPKGVERPGYIHPSSEPIKASMEKQAKIKEDIRLLLNLTIANLRPSKNTSADSKAFDQGTLENGLTVIGLALENAERAIAKIFAEYTATAPATVKYPTNYSLKTDSDRRIEAKELIEISDNVQSLSYKKEVAKRIVSLTLGFTVSEAKLNTIFAEIDAAKTINTVDTIQKDVELGNVSREYASKLLGYPDGEAAKANKEHAERARVINDVQQSTVPDNAVPGQNKAAKEAQNNG